MIIILNNYLVYVTVIYFFLCGTAMDYYDHVTTAIDYGAELDSQWCNIPFFKVKHMTTIIHCMLICT